MTVLAYKSRTLTRTVTIQDVDCVPIIPSASDKIRASIMLEGMTPVFTVTSGTNTANGSYFLKGSPCELRIDAADLAFAPGIYNLVIDYLEVADSAISWKNVDREVFVLENT